MLHEQWTAFIVFLAGLFASSAGVGGGALYIPTLVLIGGETNSAIPLAKCITFGVAIALWAFNFFKTTPIASSRPELGKKPLISYSVALLMEPMTLAGSVLGVRANRVLPFYVKTLLLVVIGTLIVYNMVRKCRRLHASECLIERRSRFTDDVLIEPLREKIHDYHVLTKAEQCLLAEFIRVESKRLPLDKILPLTFCWVLLLIETFVDGLIKCGSPMYWFFILSSIPLHAAITWWTARQGIRQQSIRDNLFDNSMEDSANSFSWKTQTVLQTSVVSFIAGILSASIGIGGSTVKGPYIQLLIDDPEVASATSSFMLLTTSSSSLFQFLILGRLTPVEALWWMMIGLCAAIVGKTFMSWLIAIMKKRSLIVFALTIYVAIGVSLMAYIGLRSAIDTVSTHSSASLYKFQSVCS